jgi:hypothetical protein
VDSFLKDLFRGFVLCKQKSQITRFVSIHKDSYTNPAFFLNTFKENDQIVKKLSRLLYYKMVKVIGACGRMISF